MNREELIGLADRILKREASEADVKAYNAWYNSFQQSGEIPVIDEEEKKAILYARIELSIEERVPVRKLWHQVARRRAGIWAAAAIATIVVGAYFFNFSKNPNSSSQTEMAAGTNDVAPGRNTAVLTLPDGKAIDLSDSKTGVVIDASSLKYNDGEKLSISSETGQLSGSKAMRIATPRGGTYQVILSDGSKVWLNAASSIKFPASFRGLKQRSIELEGEAYFEIHKNKMQPFVVTTRSQRVKVLGTHFNISSYADERNVETTLLEGAVQVCATDQRKATEEQVILKPGQQSVVSGFNRIDVKNVDVADIVAWKEGKFVFVRENVRSIMNKISRWYDVDVVYNGDVRNKALGGSVSRFKNVSEVLEMLSATKAVQFRIEGRRVVVMPYKE
jgi:ferric-dicitrate binding protein FerR (iron transport regulator)